MDGGCEDQPTMHVVIMAGGGGTRLRPLSTAARPKPFLPLLPTGETLIQRTVARLAGAELGTPAVSVVVSRQHASLVREQVPGVDVIEEPEGRNTAAAIALAALAGNRPDDEVMAVLPADHHIDPAREDAFRRTLAGAAEDLATGAFGVAAPLVTLGVRVTRPATEYGYLIPHVTRQAQIGALTAYPLAAFEEKPDAARAERLLGQPGVAWNAGMFVWQRAAIRAALTQYAPDVIRAVERGLAGDLAAAYRGIVARSIDYAVMEAAAAAGHVVMAGMDAGWTDVGTWPALLEILGAPDVEGDVVEAGEEVTVTDQDLVVERGGSGECTVRPTEGGTMTADAPFALLRGARPHESIVADLIKRCAA
jgi:mannose-1-phosphate guanylyltransferase